VQARQATYAGEIDSMEWILRLLKSLKIRAQDLLDSCPCGDLHQREEGRG
jgi:hypothetical protein